MTDTSGPSSGISSVSSEFQRSLVNKLKQRSATAGSILYKLTWKEAVTPSGRSYSLLRASAHRTPVTDSGSWPTTQARDWKNPDVSRASNPERSNDLSDFALLGVWPTTTKEDMRSSARHGYMITGNAGTTLLDAARMAYWTTPCATEGASRPNKYAQGGSPLSYQVGLIVIGSPAETGKPVRLNPRLSGWLMGFPPSWDLCASRIVTAPRTKKSSPRSSRKRKTESSN